MKPGEFIAWIGFECITLSTEGKFAQEISMKSCFTLFRTVRTGLFQTAQC